MKKVSAERALYVDLVEHIYNLSGTTINQAKLTKASYVMLVTVDAELTFIKNNTIYKMRPGQMICCKPYDVFEYFSVMPQNIVYSVQFYSDSKLLDEFTEGVYTLNKECMDAFLNFFKTGEEKFHSGSLPMTVKKNQPSLTEQQMVLNMLEYAILLSYNSMELDKSASVVIDQFSKEVKTFIEVVRNNLTKWLTAPELAALCHMSLSNLKKHVAEYFPEGIKTFFMKEKINYAIKLLLAGERVDEISRTLAFPTTYYFSTVFKRHTGMSPTAYKKQYLTSSKSNKKRKNIDRDNMKTSEKVKEIIKKWYKEISFDSKYDDEFNEALLNIYVDENAKAEEYNIEEDDGKKNFLHYLYFCEELKRKYEEKKIPLKYLYDNLQDMPRWLDTWSDLKGELYFGELAWFRWHFKPQLFKVGRLQYFMYQSFEDIPQKNIKNGDNILAMHIPADGSLSEEKCIESIKEAKMFFKTYYPEFEYEHITCHSWLLGDTVDSLVKKDSNIMKFKNLFDIFKQDESDGILNYVIGWQVTRDDVKEMQFEKRIQNEIKTRILAGEVFYAGLGVVKDKYYE